MMKGLELDGAMAMGWACLDGNSRSRETMNRSTSIRRRNITIYEVLTDRYIRYHVTLTNTVCG